MRLGYANSASQVFYSTTVTANGAGRKNTGYEPKVKAHWTNARGGKCTACERKLAKGELILKSKNGKFCARYECGRTRAVLWGVK
jgi:hypothetical protein